MGSSGEPCTSPSEFVSTALTLPRRLKISSSSQSIPHIGDGVGACTGQAIGSFKCIDGAGASLDLVKIGGASS